MAKAPVQFSRPVSVIVIFKAQYRFKYVPLCAVSRKAERLLADCQSVWTLTNRFCPSFEDFNSDNA